MSARNSPDRQRRDAQWWRSLCALRCDGRRSLTTLSRETGVPVSTIFEWLRRSPLIRRATVLLDFGRVGGVHVWVLLGAVPSERVAALEAFLARQPAVNTVQRVMTDAQFLVEAILPDARAVEGFVDALHHGFRVGVVRLLYVLGDVVREGYLTDPVRYPTLTATEPPLTVQKGQICTASSEVNVAPKGRGVEVGDTLTV